MTQARAGVTVVAILCCLCLQASDQAKAEQEEYAPMPTVRCRADRIDRPAAVTSPLVLRGHAEVTFPAFRLRAEKIEVSLPDPKAPHPTETMLVIADHDVVLQQGSQELRFRELTFTIDVPK